MSNHLLLAVETQLKLLARATGDNATAAPVAPPRTVADGYPYSSKQQLAFAILFIFPILALLVVGLRVYARLKFRQFGIDDSLICIAMLISCGETFSSYMYIRKAYFGVHIWDVPIDSDMANAWMWNFVVQIMYNPILAVVKTSVLLFLMRLGGQKPGIRWSIHFLNAFNIMLGIGTFVTVIFQCTPVDFYWEAHAKTPPTSGSCIDMGAFYVSTAGLTILTDILVLALPVWIFMGLKMAFKLKVALVCVFSLGGVVTIVSILRLVQIYEFSYGKPSADPTYDIRFIYSAVETNLAIIAASAPAIRGLISKWFPGFFTSVSSHVVYGTDGLAVSGNKKSRSASRGPAGALESGRSTLGASHSDSFAMKSMKKHDPNAIPSPTASEEHIMAMSYDGIVRKTEVSVAYDDQGRSIDERQYRSHSRDASSDAAGISGYSRTMASPGV